MHEIMPVAVQEKFFIVLSASRTHTRWANTLKVVSKFVLIQSAEMSAF